MMHYCEIARNSLESWIVRHQTYTTGFRVGQKGGCFVTLLRPNRELRGCIGTINPVQDDLAREIIENAVSAGTRDPRFPAVAASELPELIYEVSVLHPPEPIDGPKQLDPKRFGVIVESGSRRGLLLPDLEGIDSIEQQIAIARKKAYIAPEEPVSLSRFEVEKFHEPDKARH